MNEITTLRKETMPVSVEAEQQVLGEMLMTNCEGAGYAAAMRAGVEAGKGDLDFSVIGQR